MFTLLGLLSTVASAEVVYGPELMDGAVPCWASSSSEEVGLALEVMEDVTLTSFDYYQNTTEGSDHIRTIRLYDRDDVEPDYALSPLADPLYETVVDLAPSTLEGMVTVEVEWSLEAGKTYHLVHPEPFRTVHSVGVELCGLVDGEVVYPHSLSLIHI